MQRPDIKRLYYSSRQISEMAQIDVKTLSEWESAFPKIKPVRHKSGKKLYRPSDFKTVLLIKKMKNKGIDDTKISAILTSEITDELIDKSKVNGSKKQVIPEIKKRLKDILNILDKEPH